MRITHSRTAALLFKISLLVAFAVGVVAVPLRVLAQDTKASPAGQTSAKSEHAAESAEATEAAKGEDETAAFRHTPLMGSIAKALHLSVDTTARIFEIFNFAIIFFGIGIPLVRFIPKHLKKRKEVLTENLETARKTTLDANSRLSAVEAQLAHLDDEIAKIRAQVEEESRQDEVRIKAAIEEESGRIVAAAEQEINVAAAQARRELRHFAADLAIDQAIRKLDLSPDADRALIAEFMSNASITGDGGGKN